MEFPIKIREAQDSDIDQICLIQESILSSLEIMNKEIIEERIRNHAGTFLLASLDNQGIAYTQSFSKSNLVHCLLTVDFKTLFSSP